MGQIHGPNLGSPAAIVTTKGELLINNTQQRGAFGDLSISELTPIVQLQYPYNINSEIVNSNTNNAGSISVVNNMANVSTGASATSRALLTSKIPVKYNPGQGVMVRFSALFTTGVTNSTQFIGIGDAGDGFYIGYQDTSFGILHRKGGSIVIQTLTLSAKSTTDENITITLDDIAKTDVAVTDQTAGTIHDTAKEIADADYSDVGNGWTATAVDDTIIFTSFDAEDKTGTFSLSGTTAAGTFAETVTGVLPTETFIAQADWNGDKFDGVDDPTILDPTKGNVFQIQYQWLGFGGIKFFIEEPDTADVSRIHTIEYANNNTIPSLNNPTLPLCIEVINTTNTSAMIINNGSMGGFIEGKDEKLGLTHSEDKSLSVTTEAAILSIRNKEVYQSKVNRTRVQIMSVNLATDGNKSTNFACYINSALGGTPVFTDHNTNVSVIEIDTAGTTITNGNKVIDVPMEKVGSNPLDTENLNILLSPGDTFTVTAKSANANIVEVGITWKELL